VDLPVISRVLYQSKLRARSVAHLSREPAKAAGKEARAADLRTIHKRFDGRLRSASGWAGSDEESAERTPSAAVPAPIGFYRPCAAGLPMRALAALLAVAATLALSGCAGNHSPVDPETADPDDYELPLVIFGIAVIVGIVLVVVNLSTQDRGTAPPPPKPPAEASPPPAWEPMDAPAPPAAPPAPSKPAQKPRRRAP
jgi:hypothetical protein